MSEEAETEALTREEKLKVITASNYSYLPCIWHKANYVDPRQEFLGLYEKNGETLLAFVCECRTVNSFRLDSFDITIEYFGEYGKEKGHHILYQGTITMNDPEALALLKSVQVELTEFLDQGRVDHG